MIKKTPLPFGDAAFFCARFSAELSRSARFSAIIGRQNSPQHVFRRTSFSFASENRGRT
jgi:hypothetical protein